jgi:hypothetical protein
MTIEQPDRFKGTVSKRGSSTMAARRYQDTYGQNTYGSWGRPATPLASPDLVEYRRVSWSAVFAGVVVAISFNLVLAVLGIGIGLTTIDPAQAESPQASTLGIAATVWWIVTALLSLASGGWVAGRLAGMPTRLDGALHGLVTWGIATMLIFWLLTSAVGSLIGGAFSVVGNALSNAAQGAAQATDQVDPNSLQGIQDEARELLAPNGGSLPQASLNVLNRIVRGEVTQEEMQSAASSLAEQAGIPEEKARETLNNWQAQYNQAVEQARQAAQTAAKTVSKAALWSFLALVLGAVAGSLGGMAGTPVGWDRY